MDDQLIVCRCEEITVGEIKQAVRDGARTVDQVKRLTRAGKGLCQGRTCRSLVERIIAQETGQQLIDMAYPNNRPPVRVVSLGVLAQDSRANEEEGKEGR